jgi:DNA-binding transcriptional LysR family regulator
MATGNRGLKGMQDADWDDLRFFLAVARNGSIAAAARYLDTNHSTVLRRLASLEKSLGARLFKRLSTGYAMTPAGEQLRDRLGGVSEQIESAQRQLAGLDAQPSGTIRVTSTDTLMQVLMPCFAAFRAEHPRIRLQVVMNNTFLSLTKREADVAIRPSNQPPENLVGRKVGHIRTALYASRAYWSAAKRKLDNCEWVVPDESLAHLAQSKWAAKHVPEDRIAASVDSLLGMRDAVLAGLGVGMLLTLLAEGSDELIRVTEPDAALDTDVWILTHADLRQVPRVQLFTQFMHERLRTTGAVIAADIRARARSA